MKHLIVICALAVTLLSGCSAIDDRISNLGIPSGEINQLPLAEAKNYIQNKSIHKINNVDGSNIIYFSSKGEAFLWHSRDVNSVKFTWAMEKHKDRYNICFHYPKGSYKAQIRVLYHTSVKLKNQEVNWDCFDLAVYAIGIIELELSDIFNLSSEKVPNVEITNVIGLPKSFSHILKDINLQSQ